MIKEELLSIENDVVFGYFSMICTFGMLAEKGWALLKRHMKKYIGNIKSFKFGEFRKFIQTHSSNQESFIAVEMISRPIILCT